jgi:hypothetical protein
MLRHRLFPYLIVLLLAELVMMIAYERMFWHPNEYLLSPMGDGMKNIYTFLYYVKYNQSYLTFEGMWYPFGDHEQYADLFFPLAFFLKFLKDIGIDLSDYSVGIFNTVLIQSVVVGAVFICAVARRYLLPAWYSVIFALLITFLSPQFGRLAGHYALSLIFAIPMTWWLVLNIQSGRKTFFWCVILTINTFMLALVQPYYLAICGLLFSVYGVFYYWGTRKIKISAALIVPFVVALLVFQLFMAISETATDRTLYPYGFFAYYSSLRSVLVASFMPIIDWVKILKIKPNTDDAEGRAYIGMIAFFMLSLTMIRWGKNLWKLRWKKLFTWAIPLHFQSLFGASLVVLTVACCVPFKFSLEHWFDYLPTAVKQFRALGRFAWAFYYVATMYASIYFYFIYKQLIVKKLNSIANTLLVIIVLV